MNKVFAAGPEKEGKENLLGFVSRGEVRYLLTRITDV